MNPTQDSPVPAAAADLLARAMASHGAGQLDQATALYRQLLAQEPEHPDALHLLGVLEAQRGQHELAAELIKRAILAKPDEGMFHNNLGNVRMERGQFDEAQESYQNALALDPGRLDALNNLGVLWGRRDRHEDAERALQRVVALAPGFIDARQNLASLYLRMGRVVDAVQQCCDALVVSPRTSSLRGVLGLAYSLMGRNDEAVAVYRSWLAAEPGNERARFYLAACTGQEVPDRAPDAFVQGTFDGFANSFDAKLAELDYRAPQLVAQAVARLVGEPARRLQMLDAGCGTGLCAPLLAPFALRLAGVDLSEGMLRKARVRGGYDELAQGDLVAWLADHPAAYDAVVSADTLCYFGALEGFAEAARSALREGGLLCFTVEAHLDEGPMPAYRLQPNGRYSHRKRYVEGVLGAAGLDPIETLPVELRMEAGVPVQGWLVSALVRSSP